MYTLMYLSGCGGSCVNETYYCQDVKPLTVWLEFWVNFLELMKQFMVVQQNGKQ